MALSRNRNAQSSTLLGDSQTLLDQENAPIAQQSVKNVSNFKMPDSSNIIGRPALGNVSNQANVASHILQKKILKKAATSKENSVNTRSNKAKEAQGSQKQALVAKKEVQPTASVMPTEDMELGLDNFTALKSMLSSKFTAIDDDDRGNPQLVSEYVQKVYRYLGALEKLYAIKEDYLSHHTDSNVKPRMRKILVDWLVQVHSRFHLLQETLYISVSLIDRFLQENVVNRSCLQLVGVTAMLIASKYEEMYSPEVNDFVYISDKTYNKDQILQMEMNMLRALDFRLGRPIPLHFLRRYSKIAGVDALRHGLAKYFMELCLAEYSVCHELPSLIAAAALYLSMQLLDDNAAEWSDLMIFHSTYNPEDMKKMVIQMAYFTVNANAGKAISVYKKYCGSKNLAVANLPELKSSKLQELASLYC